MKNQYTKLIYSILFQLRYKTETDEELLYNCIVQCLESDEFFIKKAIGWALREYSNPNSVHDFVNSNQLSKLSRTVGINGYKVIA